MTLKPVLVQKIIHPTPHKPVAFFRSYDLSVAQTSDTLRRLSAIHSTSASVPLQDSILSHIHLPPRLCRDSQKPVLASFGLSIAVPIDN
jgi:hypothetical protein